MKFEIDDKTGFLLIEPENGIIPSNDNAKIYRVQLEEILQAVKKTQEKLVNKQIQEIQDSKNQDFQYAECIVDKEEPFEIRKGCSNSIQSNENIEQNQKIVEEIIQSYRSLVKDGALKDVHEVEFSIVQELESIIEKSTGRDIKEL